MADRALVIGSGAAGLTAAAVLAELGQKVMVVERAPVVAPLIRGFTRRGRYCDVGLHYTGGLAEDGLLSRVLGRLSIVERLQTVALNRDGFDHIIWPERDLDLWMPVGPEMVAERLSQAFPSSAAAVSAYLQAVASVLEETPFLNPEVSPEHYAPSAYERVSLADFLREAGGEDGLIDLLGRYGELLYGLGAEQTPLLTHAVVVGSYFASAHLIHGGGRALADAWQQRLQELDVEIRVGKRVTRLVQATHGAVTGVELDDGEILTAGTVIFTAHPALLPEMLADERLRATYQRRLDAAENTAGMFVGFVAEDQGVGPDDHNTYVFSEGGGGRPRMVGLMAGSPQPAGSGRSRCLIRDVLPSQLGAPDAGGVGRRSESYKEMKLRMLQSTMTALREICGTPDGDAEVLEILTPYSFRDWTGSAEGSAYGLQRRAGERRRLNPLTPLPNLYLAGQSLLCPGIMGAVASALVACGHSVGHDRLWRQLLS